MKKIIIRTPNFLGDTINISPCIQLIRHEYPDAQIVIVCPDFIKDVYKYDKNIYKCITFPDAKRHKLSTFWNLWRKLRHEKGDLGILFINTFISALIFKLAGIKCSIGYQRECRGILLDFKIPFNINKHYINRYASLFNEVPGNKYKTLPDLYLPISNNSTFHFNNTNPILSEDEDSMGYEKYFMEQLNIEALKQDYPYDREMIDGIMELILDVVCSKRKIICIAGDVKSVNVVKGRFMKLNMEHIRYVMKCMQENTTKIRSIKQYMLAALYNAPATIDSYYRAEVNHDMAEGKI